MATPYDNAGGLLGIDPEMIKKLLAQFAPTEDDTRQANSNALMTLGLGLLGTRKGQGMDRLGFAGTNALNARAGSLHDATAAKHAQMAAAQQALQLQGALQSQADEQMFRKTAMGYAQGGAGGPGGPSTYATGGAGGGPMVAPPAAAPGAMPAAAPRLSTSKGSDYEQAIAKAQYYESKGVPPKYVEAAYAAAEKLRPKSAGITTMTDPSGKRVQVQRFEDGTLKVLPDLGPDAEKAVQIDTGGQINAADPYTLQPIAGGGVYSKQMTPGETASNKVAQGNLAVAQGHLGLARNADQRAAANLPVGELKETADGLVRIGRDNSVTPITAGGAQLQPVPSGAIKQAIAQNGVTIRLANEAIGAVKANPSAFGGQNVLGDTIQQYVDPNGVAARAKVANLSSQKFHDRSGANITASESPRLQPFIPQATDRPNVVVTKLEGFIREAAIMNNELQGGRSLQEVTVPQGKQGGALSPAESAELAALKRKHGR